MSIDRKLFRLSPILLVPFSLAFSQVAFANVDTSGGADVAASGDAAAAASATPQAPWPATLSAAASSDGMCRNCDLKTAGAVGKQWQARVRGIAIIPTGSSRGIHPTFPDGRIRAHPAYVPEIDFTYMFTDHIGAELILATSRHHVGARHSIRPVGRAAKTWVLPPTLTVQYHLNQYSKYRPYVGAGINYTVFYSEKASASLKEAIGPTHVKIHNSVGYAFQIGMDVDITSRFFFNVDLKYLHMNPKTRLRTLGSDGSVLVNHTRTHINPLIAGVGFGMRL